MIELIEQHDEEAFFNMTRAQQVAYLHNRFDSIDVNALDMQEFDDYCWHYGILMVLEYAPAPMCLRIDTNDPSLSAATDGKEIDYNPTARIFDGAKDNAEKLLIFQGLICHEILHAWYTDFESDNAWLKKVWNLSFMEPELQQVMTVMQNDNKLYKRTTRFFQNLQNTLEDARIEHLATAKFDSWFQQRLSFMRKHEIARTEHLRTPNLAAVVLIGYFASVDLFGGQISDIVMETVSDDIKTRGLVAYENNRSLFAQYIGANIPEERNKIMTQLFINLFPVLLEDHKKRGGGSQ